jgi:hypothetical protein
VARKKPAPEPSLVVHPIKLEDSRELLTVEPNDGIWDRSIRESMRPDVEGTIVRLRPSASRSDGEVEEVRAWFEKGGAARVSVLPRPRAEVIPAAVAEHRPDRAVGAREAVTSLVEESNSKNKALLRELCEQVMAKCGL